MISDVNSHDSFTNCCLFVTGEEVSDVDDADSVTDQIDHVQIAGSAERIIAPIFTNSNSFVTAIAKKISDQQNRAEKKGQIKKSGEKTNPESSINFLHRHYENF